MNSISREKIDILIGIQDLEKNIQIVETKLRDIPKKLETLDKDLIITKESITVMDFELKELRKKYRSIEDEIHINQSRGVKNQEKLGSVKTNKEYQSVLKEIDDLKKKTTALEDEMLMVMEQIEEIESVISEKKIQSDILLKKMEQDKKAVQAEAEEGEKKLAELMEKREKASKMVDPKLFEKYTGVRHLVGRMAIVPVRKAVCQGCHLNIPHQMYNELQRYDSIRFCPHCQRMIYYE